MPRVTSDLVSNQLSFLALGAVGACPPLSRNIHSTITMSSLFAISPSSARIPLSNAIRSTSTICAQCRRSFTTNAILSSGHNKWSKIKHEKAAADKKKHTQRGHFSKTLTMYSKMYGADPNLNTQLASVITLAKKAGMPKAVIDLAIARGQGKSETGASLETLTLEVMLAPSVAMVVDIETDNKLRSLNDLRPLVKKHGGTITPTAFLFTRQGRVVLSHKNDDSPNYGPNHVNETKENETIDFDEVMMQALDAGAEDVEKDDEGNVVLWTQPNMTQQVAQNLAKTLGLDVMSSDILWSCMSDKVKVDDDARVNSLAKLLSALQEYPDVQAVYVNAERGDVSEEAWSAVEEALDS
ncbi:duf28 domain-containing protein [Xylaria castorea]|nr:duf28 domain-containing protein [Xylaria castorea]